MSHSNHDRVSPDEAPDRSNPPASFRPLRAWPALALVALMLAARYGPQHLEGGLSKYWMIAVFGPMLCCLLLVIWWLAASRATWRERLLGFLGLVAGAAATVLLVHPTMRGPGTTYVTVPMGLIAFALGAAGLRRRRPILRTGLALVCAFAGLGFSLLLRNEGMRGDYVMGLHWRWTPSPEEMMLAAAENHPSAANPAVIRSSSATNAPSSATNTLDHAEWPGFRGAGRTAHVTGVRLATNWTAQPPRQLWKIRVGPAWSSFAVAGDRLFTQEQRGPMETVVCYDAGTGREIWKYEIEARLEDPLGGPGPRATPTLGQGGVFATFATGALLRLDPKTGAVVWKQDLPAVAGRGVPMWGFAASPLLVGPRLILYAGGPGDKGVLAFNAASGALEWSAPAGPNSYSSPQLSRLADQETVLMLSDEGLTFLDPATGHERLNYPWKFGNYRALQPALANSDTVLLPTGMSTGTRAIRVTQADGRWQAEELWTSRNLKPDFNDLVVYQGCAYGFDGAFFTCVDLQNGDRKWKGGRYGKGQVLLLEDSGLLLVAAESGQVVLLEANPAAHLEIDSFKALEGKTWNHPVLVGDRLYLRNSQEAACFQMPLARALVTAR